MCSHTGLEGVPTALLYLHKEVGLAGDTWNTLGARWQALAQLWLHAEAALAKSAHSDLSFTQIHKSAIPEDWKDWMNAKLMNIDARPPAESFIKAFTNYLKGLNFTMADQGITVMSTLWCHPGKTGIVGLLLCLHWQAEYSGAGHDWDTNIKCVEAIFNTILTLPL